MNSPLLDLFHDVFQLMYSVSMLLRLRDPHADGLGFWAPLRDMLSPHDHHVVAWRHLWHDEFDLPEKDEHGTLLQENHFRLQQRRLPTAEVANLRRVLQVALNLGQYDGVGGLGSTLRLNDYLDRNAQMTLASDPGVEKELNGMRATLHTMYFDML